MKLLFIAITSIALTASSDYVKDALVAYKRFKKSFYKQQTYTMKITKGLFDEETDQVLRKSSVQLFVKGDKIRQESENELLVSDGELQIVANHSVKTLVIQKVIKKKKKESFEKQFTSNMDSLITWSSHAVKDETDVLEKYHLFYKKGPFEKIHIAFDKKNGFLRSIAYVPVEVLENKDNKNHKMLIRVAFSDVSTTTKLSNDLFNINAFVKLGADNKFKSIGICSGYKILNN